MSTAHPLRDIERIDGPPGPYLEAIGTIFATFGAPTQDSGNVSYGVQVGGERFFVKTTDPEAEVFCDHADPRGVTVQCGSTQAQLRSSDLASAASHRRNRARPSTRVRLG